MTALCHLQPSVGMQLSLLVKRCYEYIVITNYWTYQSYSRDIINLLRDFTILFYLQGLRKESGSIQVLDIVLAGCQKRFSTVGVFRKDAVSLSILKILDVFWLCSLEPKKGFKQGKTHKSSFLDYKRGPA